jgi:hypothetical protein
MAYTTVIADTSASFGNNIPLNLADAATSSSLFYSGASAISSSPVELQVTNLDQTIEGKDLKMLVTRMFKTHVGVLHVSTFYQSDGNLAACVR